ncbi:winged helix-turn-helix transcriptional regulator [Thermosporothrix hazakensis]|jgi:DNA-binding HxlR family transcriptional regulator|uniref:winged helix-turn-helix transcriptional regulator n=1 Tax=Thermosporothrix hazakensis TaxID=644383 RepID=UPI000DAE7504|nr:helix-turn-helix domain-containing protein [Thermosporothrix hazakensis]GCE50100.1 transcriptional regulator [Thermosporothrix hazakensis]
MERVLETSSPHSVLIAHCPSRQVLDLIADKWTALVFALLEKRPTRFNEMQRAIEGVSHKMLTQTLRNLEQRGIIERKVTSTVPPAVEYSLSPLGTTLIPLMRALRQWAEEHMEEVEQARQSYQEKAGKELV